MNRMSFFRPLGLAAGAFALLATACGGGGGDGEAEGPRVTDPAIVATATPIGNTVLYTIKQDGSVSASGAASSVTVPAGPTLTGGGSTTTQQQPGSYTVESNDTCAAIAEAHELTIDQLLAANRVINCDNLRIGDVLRIPVAPNSASTPRSGGRDTGTSGNTYTVASGDNCSAIADAHGVSVDALLSANPSIDSDCTNIDVGDVLNIP